jgi:hypothetical protein
MSNSTAIAVVPFDQLNTMAKAFADSGMFGAKNQQQALSLLLLAQAEGVHPAVAMRDFDIIQGRPAKKAQAMHRAFIEAGGKIVWHERTDTKAEATFSHPQGGTVRVSWDMERARKAGLSNKDMYGKYGRQMLSSRVISEGCRTVYPAATSGLYVPEEVKEFKPSQKEKDMGMASVVTDEDITNQIPGAGAPAVAQASPAPQAQPLSEEAPPSSSSSSEPAGASFISADQMAHLKGLFAACDKLAEEQFLKVAKIDNLELLKSSDYDEALDWVERRKKRFTAK